MRTLLAIAAIVLAPALVFGQYGGDKSNVIPASGGIGTWSLVQGPGSCGGAGHCQLNIPNTTLTLSAAANASGGTTVYTTTGTCVVNSYYDVRGFTTAANNGGPWIATAVSAGVSCTLANPSGVSESHAATQILVSATMTINANLTAGNQYIALATVQGDAPPGYQISTITSGGTSIGTTLTHPPECTIGGMQSGPAFSRDCVLVYPGASSGSGSTSLLFVVTGNAGNSTNIAFYEYHPSANGSNVALDNSSGWYQGYSTQTTWLSQAFTTTGTNDLMCVTAFDGAGGPFVTINSFSGSFSTNAYLASSRAFSCAISTSAPTVTWASAVDSQISSFTLGWNPTAYQSMGVANWAYSGGSNPPVSGNALTGIVMANGLFGWQNFVLTLNQNNTNQMLWSNSASCPGLLNNTGRMDDGSSVTASGTNAMCIAMTGNNISQTQFVKFDFGRNSTVPYMHVLCRLNDDFATGNTSTIDACNLHTASADFAALNWYPAGGVRIFQMETPEGNGGSWNLTGGNCSTICPVTADVYFQTGSGGNTASSVSASQSGATSTFTGTFTAANWPVGYAFEATGCSGGGSSGWNYVKGAGGGDTGIFYVASANASTITATQLVNSSPTGTPSSCTLTGVHVITLYDKSGNLLAQSAHPGNVYLPGDYRAQFPNFLDIGPDGNQTLTTSSHLWWGPVTIGLGTTRPPL